MDYISAEEFLKQSEKVQKCFREWLEENLGECDWVKIIDRDVVLWVDSVLDTKKDDIDVGRVFYFGRQGCWTSIYDPDVVPLFTEGQLRKFIQDKTVEKIKNSIEECVPILLSSHLANEGYCIYLMQEYEVKGEKRYHMYTHYETNTDDLLQAYWQVATKLAEEK